MLSEKKFYAFFPEAKLIKDDALRQKSFEAFADAAEMGGWTEDTIERCPSAVAEFVDSPATQIRHLQDSIQLSLMIGTYLKEHYGAYIDFNMDYVLAGALLHDLGKFTEYAVDDNGKPYVTENGTGHPRAVHQHGLRDLCGSCVSLHVLQ